MIYHRDHGDHRERTKMNNQPQMNADERGLMAAKRHKKRKRRKDIKKA